MLCSICQCQLRSARSVCLPAGCRFPLEVEPSVLPVAIQLQRNGQPLPTREVQGEDGITTVAVLEGVPAGSSGGGWDAAGPRAPH